MDLSYICKCSNLVRYSISTEADSAFPVTCSECGKVMKIINHVRPPALMSIEDRISWCIVLVKQSLRDCSFWRFRERRKLKADLLVYESGNFPL